MRYAEVHSEKDQLKSGNKLPSIYDSSRLLIHLKTEAIGLVGIQALKFDIQAQIRPCPFLSFKIWSMSEMHYLNKHKRGKNCQSSW